MIPCLPTALCPLLLSKICPGAFGRSVLYGTTAWLLLTTAQGSLAASFDKKPADLQVSPNGTSFVWTIQDTYAGKTFFEYVLLILPMCCC
jgi:hypothetical protein